jgi:hypothetical protein
VTPALLAYASASLEPLPITVTPDMVGAERFLEDGERSLM